MESASRASPANTCYFPIRRLALLYLHYNRCVPLIEFEETTRALAKRLATGPTRIYGLIKELMYKSLDMDLQASLHLEGQLQEAAYATADYRESVDAFLHKRAARFSGT